MISSPEFQHAMFQQASPGGISATVIKLVTAQLSSNQTFRAESDKGPFKGFIISKVWCTKGQVVKWLCCKVQWY